MKLKILICLFAIVLSSKVMAQNTDRPDLVIQNTTWRADNQTRASFTYILFKHNGVFEIYTHLEGNDPHKFINIETRFIRGQWNIDAQYNLTLRQNDTLVILKSKIKINNNSLIIENKDNITGFQSFIKSKYEMPYIPDRITYNYTGKEKGEHYKIDVWYEPRAISLSLIDEKSNRENIYINEYCYPIKDLVAGLINSFMGLFHQEMWKFEQQVMGDKAEIGVSTRIGVDFNLNPTQHSYISYENMEGKELKLNSTKSLNQAVEDLILFLKPEKYLTIEDYEKIVPTLQEFKDVTFKVKGTKVTFTSLDKKTSEEFKILKLKELPENFGKVEDCYIDFFKLHKTYKEDK